MQRFKGLALAGAAVLVAYLAGTYARKADVPSPSHDRDAAMEAAVAGDDAAETEDVETVQTGYVCPMHSHITSDHEGECPICGMDLVPQETASASDEEAEQNGNEMEQGASVAHEDQVQTPSESPNKQGAAAQGACRGADSRRAGSAAEPGETDPKHHSLSAQAIAREHFDSKRVLGGLLRELGFT